MVAGSAIKDVHFVKLKVNGDPRGSFTEVFKKSWGTPLDPVQFSIVHSGPRVMRGCHLHWRHDEYFTLLTGAASVGLRDERRSSPTRNSWSLFYLCEEEPAALIFPRGLVHGWYFHEQSVHLQAVSEAYDDYAQNDNHRIFWQDPALEIPWPAKEAVMTDLAQHASNLAEIRKKLS